MPFFDRLSPNNNPTEKAKPVPDTEDDRVLHEVPHELGHETTESVEGAAVRPRERVFPEPSEEDRKKEAALFLELAEVNSSLGNKVSAIEGLLNVYSRGIAPDVPAVPPLESLQSVEARIAKLEGVRDTKTYLDEASLVARQLLALEKEMRAKIASQKDEQATLTEQDHALKLRSWESNSLLQMASKFFENRKIKQERASIAEKLRIISENDTILTEGIRQVSEKRWAVREKMTQVARAAVERLCRDDLSPYIDQTWESIENNPALMTAIVESYAQNVIQPLFEKKRAEEQSRAESAQVPEQTFFDEASEKEFFRVIRMSTVDGNIEESQTTRSLLARSGSGDLRAVCDPILRHAEKPFLGRIFVEKILEKMSPIVASLLRLQGDEPYSRWGRMDEIFPIQSDAIRYPLRANIEGRTGMYLSGINVDMSMWQSLKDTPLVNSLFRNEIGAVEQKIEGSLLQSALIDSEGSDIEKLFYLPTPESMRTVFILAATEAHGYRTVHATNVIKKWAEKSDWPELLRTAEVKYPGLEKMGKFILDSAPNGYVGDPSIRDASYDVAISVVRAEKEKKLYMTDLRSLALGALPDKEIVALLAEQGGISAKEEKDFQAAWEIMNSEENRHLLFDVRGDLREVFLKALRKTYQDGGSEAPMRPEDNPDIQRALFISRKIMEQKDNPQFFRNLRPSSVTEQAKKIFATNDPNAEVKIDALYRLHQEVPQLLDPKNYEILENFCKSFQGQETINTYRRILDAYSGAMTRSESGFPLNKIFSLLSENKLSEERVLELARPIQTKRGVVDFTSERGLSKAFDNPEIFLATNDGLDFLVASKQSGIDALDPDLEYFMNDSLRGMEKKQEYDARQIRQDIAVQSTNAFLTGKSFDGTMTEANWKGILLSYIRSEEGGFQPTVDTVRRMEQVKELFLSDATKDFCLKQTREMWTNYLASGDKERFPFSLEIISEYIKAEGGAGPLSRIEALALFAATMRKLMISDATGERTKNEIFSGMQTAEERFVKDRWSEDARVDFYNTSRDVIGAAPSLFSAYAGVFEKMSPKEFQQFSDEAYPLHRVMIVLSEKIDSRGNKSTDARALAGMREEFIYSILDANGNMRPIAEQKKALMDWVTETFGTRFGIKKIPETLTQEHVRSLKNISLYLSNIAQRDGEKETLLSFYLALMINNRWDDFRRGTLIDPGEYLDETRAQAVRTFLREKERLNPLNEAALGLKAGEMPEFSKLLESETENVALGNIETVDVKLNNVIFNLDGLRDLDLYPEPLDKKRMEMLLTYGNKRLGAVTAKMYQQLTRPGERPTPSPEDEEIQAQIEAALHENGLPVNAESIKQYFQEEMRQFSVVANILSFVEEIGARREIEELRSMLKPTPEIIALFNKLGEEFRPTSGAIAIAQDLEYLDNLIVKKEADLTEDERALVKGYLGTIREKVTLLGDIHEKIVKKFAGLKQGRINTGNELLRSKLESIDKIINAPESQQVITSGMTSNLNYIIENMRECLACVRQGSNNDTNLAFGDPNRFYLYSKTETRIKSIADEVVFLEPTVFEDGTSEMSFVFDKVYGTTTPTVLINQVEAVLKKYSALKKRFPEAKLSLLVSDTAMQSVGVSPETLKEKLTRPEVTMMQEMTAEVNVIKSAASDHYVEFGGGARVAGKRTIKGLVIRK